MVRGIIFGSFSALALAMLFIVAVSLVAPPPGAPRSQARAVQPDVLVPLDQSEPAVTRPEPLPVTDAAQTPEPAAPTPSGTVLASAPVTGVELPAASQFNRPREDGAVVIPEGDARPADSLRAGPAGPDLPGPSPAPDTASAQAPFTGAVAALAAPPSDGARPDLPAPLEERAPRTFRDVTIAEPVAADAAPEEVAPVDTATLDEPVEVTPEIEVETDPEPTEIAASEETAVEDDPAPVVLVEVETLPAEDVAAEEFAALEEAPAPHLPTDLVVVEASPEEEELDLTEEIAPKEAHAPVPEAVTVAAAEEAPLVEDAAPIVQEIVVAEAPVSTDPAGSAQAPLIVLTPSADEDAPQVTDTLDIRLVEPEDVTEVAPRPVTSEPAVTVAETGNRPRRIVLDSAREAEAPEIATEAPTPGGADGPALDAHAAVFAGASDKPLLSIVLIDDGSIQIDRAVAASFGFPVAFAIDPTASDAVAAMEAYRNAGHEVLLLTRGLAPGGQPQDVEVALAGARAALPQAVGVLQAETDGAGSRSLSSLLPGLSEAGMGLVAFPQGLGSVVSTARRAGVPATQFYRVIDGDGARAPRISRALDRATFEAAQDGSAVVVGRMAPETVTALQSWALGSRSESVATAPVSAVLKANAN